MSLFFGSTPASTIASSTAGIGITATVISGGYKLHTFTGNTNITFSTNTYIDVLLIGAGGGDVVDSRIPIRCLPAEVVLVPLCRENLYQLFLELLIH